MFSDLVFFVSAYVMVEKSGPFQRKPGFITSVVGYAGGRNGAKAQGSDGLVCYHHGGDQSNVYGHLGHAEAVEIILSGANGSEVNGLQFKALVRSLRIVFLFFCCLRQFLISHIPQADDFFSSFHKVSGGMQRPDPGDRGGEYRNMVVSRRIPTLLSLGFCVSSWHSSLRSSSILGHP
jgi:hypothetical protein